MNAFGLSVSSMKSNGILLPCWSILFCNRTAGNRWRRGDAWTKPEHFRMNGVGGVFEGPRDSQVHKITLHKRVNQPDNPLGRIVIDCCSNLSAVTEHVSQNSLLWLKKEPEEQKITTIAFLLGNEAQNPENSNPTDFFPLNKIVHLFVCLFVFTSAGTDPARRPDIRFGIPGHSARLCRGKDKSRRKSPFFLIYIFISLKGFSFLSFEWILWSDVRSPT